VNGGPGGYDIPIQGRKFGFTVGGGLGYPLTSFMVAEIKYNYQSTVGAAPNVSFSRLQGGVVFKVPKR
jgi:opacity protein-like surface antigen